MAEKKYFFLVLFFLFLLLSILPGGIAAQRALRVQETDFVKITPESTDLDNDQIQYRFSLPLDELGEWQTDYGDAGEYEIEIIASDGTTETAKTIQLIVDQKNRPPEIVDKRITVKETQVVDLKPLVEDVDGDPLTFAFPLPFDREGRWRTTFGDAGRWIMNFTISDGQSSILARAEITVLPTNRQPRFEEMFSKEEKLSLRENETLHFFIKAVDPERKKLQYSWLLDNQSVSLEEMGAYHFSFDSAGTHLLELQVSDGESEVKQSWMINVLNTNRKPTLNILPITIYESDTIQLDLPQQDADGDRLTFSFSPPLDKEGSWSTGFDDAGIYMIPITANDGELEERQLVEITVVNVDRSPVLDVPARIELSEGEYWSWKIATEDPDHENLTITFENLPSEAQYDARNRTLYWQPPFETVQRPGGMISDALNALRLEQFLLQEKEFSLVVISCGSELCSTAKTVLVVKNVNRPPTFGNWTGVTAGITADITAGITAGITAQETELINFNPLVHDPDGDIVRLYYTSPLGKRSGEWETHFGDQGNYTIYVTATDGQEGTTIPVPLSVFKNNRQPTIKVSDNKVDIDEGEQLLLQVGAHDQDNDPLDVWLEDPPQGVSFQEGVFLWSPPLTQVQGQDSGIWWLRFIASDGEAEVASVVEVSVKNKNVLPEIVASSPAEESAFYLSQPVVFQVAAQDSDQDVLQYTWDFGLAEKDVYNTTAIERTFTSPGKKHISVTVSDGRAKVRKDFRVNVLPLQAASSFSNDPGDNGQMAFSVKVIKH